MRKRGDHYRIVAIIVCMCIALTILFATGFAFLHGSHECSGAHCGVCEHLKDLANVSKNIGEGVGLLLPAFLLITAFLKALPTFLDKFLSAVSLISLKVRMNN